MARSSQDPRSVGDGVHPAAWRGMIDEQRARNAQQAADLADRMAQWNSLAERTSDDFAKWSGEVDDLAAAKAFRKFTGPVGAILSASSAQRGYKADRLRGMPADEAAIKNGGGQAAGTLIGSAGAAAGATICAPLAPFGGPIPSILCAAAGGYMGGKDGERLARWTAEGWRDTKAKARTFVNSLTRDLGAINTPSTWAVPKLER